MRYDSANLQALSGFNPLSAFTTHQKLFMALKALNVNLSDDRQVAWYVAPGRNDQSEIVRLRKQIEARWFSRTKLRRQYT